MPPLNAFTVDVEDYFQVTAFDGVVKRSDWDHIPSRVEQNTRRMLELLADHDVRGTFFVLGWVADRFPHLVREIAAAGHEIGSHSYWHRLIYQQTPDEFRDDLIRSKQVLEDLLSKPVTAYRAPTFSITAASQWALEILVEEGFTIDSSLFPLTGHDRYGMAGVDPVPHRIETSAGPLLEAPLSVTRVCWKSIPAGGGGYFRLYPFWLTDRLIGRLHAAGLPLIFYIHPWEIDPEQPRQAGLRMNSRLRQYLGLPKTYGRLQQLLRRHEFSAISSVIERSVLTSSVLAGAVV